MATTTDSILLTVKKLVGVDADYDAFDTELIIHINSVLATLHQIGIGPDTGLMIVDESSQWSDLISNVTILNNVKSFIGIKVRLLFDPPPTSFALDSYTKVANEYEWRLMVAADPPSTQIVIP